MAAGVSWGLAPKTKTWVTCGVLEILDTRMGNEDLGQGGGNKIWDKAAQAAMVEDALRKCTVLIFPTVHGGGGRGGGGGTTGGRGGALWIAEW